MGLPFLLSLSLSLSLTLSLSLCYWLACLICILEYPQKQIGHQNYFIIVCHLCFNLQIFLLCRLFWYVKSSVMIRPIVRIVQTLKRLSPKLRSILFQPALNFSNCSIWSEIPNWPIDSRSKHVFHHVWGCIYGI